MSAPDPNIPVWPIGMLTPQSVAPRKIAPIFSSPPALAAAPQTVQNAAGRWGLSLKSIRVATPDQRLTLRALLGRLTSPLRPVYVSPMDWLVSPRRRAGMAQAATMVPFSDSSSFSDGTEFSQPAVDFTIAAAAAANATTVYVQPATAALLEGGQLVQIGDRLHELDGVWPDATFGAGGQRVQIWPPLRDSVAVGDAIEAENPLARVTIDPKSAEVATELMFARYAYIDLEFTEDRW